MGGWPVELSDTAGLRSTGDALEAAGMELAESRLAAADAIVLVFDIRGPWDENAGRLIARWPGALVVYNKADLAGLPADCRPAGICTSAIDGRGLSQLEQALVRHLVPVEPAAGMALAFTSRQAECWQRILAAVDLPDVVFAQATGTTGRPDRVLAEPAAKIRPGGALDSSGRAFDSRISVTAQNRKSAQVLVAGGR